MRSEKIMISSHTSESTSVFVPHSDWLQYCETKPGQQRFACQGSAIDVDWEVTLSGCPEVHKESFCHVDIHSPIIVMKPSSQKLLFIPTYITADNLNHYSIIMKNYSLGLRHPLGKITLLSSFAYLSQILNWKSALVLSVNWLIRFTKPVWWWFVHDSIIWLIYSWSSTPSDHSHCNCFLVNQ